MPPSKFKTINSFSIVTLRHSNTERGNPTDLSEETKAPFPCKSTDNLTSDDPARLLPELLDRLVALGDMARQLSQALGGNGHRPEKLSEVVQQLVQGGDHDAP